MALAALLQAGGAQALDQVSVDRTAPHQVVVSWAGVDPVDVFVSPRSDASIAESRHLATADRAGTYTLQDTGSARPYFLLRDERDGGVSRVAERLLPLEQGSNFRDIGGYPAAGGRHVRWGLIYRSAATPMLTPSDLRYMRQLGIRTIVDFRSTEERQMSPDPASVTAGADDIAVDYSANELLSRIHTPAGGAPPADARVNALYRDLPVLLAPQLRALFRSLLRQQGAVRYHCSAGQDRTGVATALVLSALGVPREVIVQDYLLSTQDRRPAYELAKVDPARYPGNTFAPFLAKMQSTPGAMTPKPLLDASSAPLLDQSFAAMDARWGGVDAYLQAELGLDPAAIQQLRTLYLE